MHLYYCLKRNKRESEALFRHALGDYLETGTPGTPKEEAFNTIISRSKLGKPYLPLFPQIKYSVSHSGDCWGCLFSSVNVGLDIEALTDESSSESVACIRTKSSEFPDASIDRMNYTKTNKQYRQSRLVRIAERFFANDEITFINSSPDSETLAARFYWIWTRKEAYIKYTGLGIGAGLSGFSVMSDSMGDAILMSVKLSEDLVTACCYEKTLSAFSGIKLIPV